MSSWITIVSVPAGIGAPVKIRAASPGPTWPPNPAPAGTSATMRNSTGIRARSSARTAYPSIAETAKGGWVRRAEIGFGENPAEPVGERNLLGRQGLDQGQQTGEGFFDRDHGTASQSPDFPPDLRNSRRSVTVIPRSTALHMS